MLIPYLGIGMMTSFNLTPDTARFDQLLNLAGKHCKREPTRRTLHDYVIGLLNHIPRHNTWQMAEFAGHDNPFLYQNMLSRANWDQEAIRTDLLLEHRKALGKKAYSLIVDETGFIKKGQHSCGVQRQYSGTAGRIENCQVGVFLACTSREHHCLLDTRLYLPQSWTKDAERCSRAGVPETIGFETKTTLAEQMILKALDAGLQPDWVLGDSIYGESSHLRQALQSRFQAFVLGITSQHYVWLGARQHSLKGIIKTALQQGSWCTLASGAGTKGARLYQWLCLPVNGCEPAGWQHTVLLRRMPGSDKPHDVAAFLCCAPASKSSLRQLARASGQRWAIETCFEEAKDLLGMDQYEVRNWVSWYRHMTLVILAHTFLAFTLADEKKNISTRLVRSHNTGIEAVNNELAELVLSRIGY